MTTDKWYWKSQLVIDYFTKNGWPSGSSLQTDLNDDAEAPTILPGIPSHLINNNKVIKDENDDVCMVCGYDDYEDNNKIMYCESCDISLH